VPFDQAACQQLLDLLTRGFDRDAEFARDRRRRRRPLRLQQIQDAIHRRSSRHGLRERR
jgi:uncharacterized membrane protein YccC